MLIASYTFHLSLVNVDKLKLWRFSCLSSECYIIDSNMFTHVLHGTLDTWHFPMTNRVPLVHRHHQLPVLWFPFLSIQHFWNINLLTVKLQLKRRKCQSDVCQLELATSAKFSHKNQQGIFLPLRKYRESVELCNVMEVISEWNQWKCKHHRETSLHLQPFQRHFN